MAILPLSLPMLLLLSLANFLLAIITVVLDVLDANPCNTLLAVHVIQFIFICVEILMFSV